MTKISVVIPTCNRHHLLDESVHSVLKQTFSPHELIIVNNGDKPIPQQFHSKGDVLNIMPRAGVSQARNFGALYATGEYVAFLDDDDLWEENYLMKMHKAISVQNHPDCLLARKDRLVDGKIVPYKNVDKVLSLQKLLVGNECTGGSNIVVKRTAFISCGGYDVGLISKEDRSLVIDMLLTGYRVVGIPEVQTIARVHDGVRLTDRSNARLGFQAFYRKYSSEMSIRQRFLNRISFLRSEVSYYKRKILTIANFRRKHVAM